MTGSGTESANNRSSEVEQKSNAGPAHLCYVDDSRTSAYVVKRLLRPYGYTVDHFNSAEPALVALVENHYDLLLTDLKVSPEGMDGDDLVRALRGNGHHHVSSLPIIVITGSTDEQVLNDVYAAGADQIMSKPVNGDELDEHIRNLVENYKQNLDSLAEVEQIPVDKEYKKSDATVVPFGHETKGPVEGELDEQANTTARRNLKNSGNAVKETVPQPAKAIKPASPVKPTIKTKQAQQTTESKLSTTAPPAKKALKKKAPSSEQLAARQRLLKAKALAKKKRMAQIAAAKRKAQIDKLKQQKTSPEYDGGPLSLEPLEDAGGSSFQVFAPTLDQQVTPETLAVRSTPVDQPIAYEPASVSADSTGQQAPSAPTQQQPVQADTQASTPQQAQVSAQEQSAPQQANPAHAEASNAQTTPGFTPPPTQGGQESPPFGGRPSGGFQPDVDAASNILQEMERYPLVEADFGNTYSPSRFVSTVGSVLELYGPRKLATTAVICVAVFFLWSTWSEYFDDGIAVQAVAVEQGEIFQAINVPGKVVSKLRTNITPSIAGRLTQIKVEEGDKVKSGDLLALLDDREAKSYLKRANANQDSAKEDVLLAERALKRLKQAFSKGAVAKQLVEEAEVELRSAKARESIAAEEVRTAKLSLENPRIVAPFGGTITARFVEVGQWVVPSETLFTLIDERQKEIEVQVESADSSGIAVGQTVGLSSEAFPGLQWSESVTRLAAAANNNGRANTVSVYISLGNSAPSLRFGQQVDADIRTAWNPNAIKLPFGAILSRHGRSYVAVYENDKVHYSEVVTGIEDFTHVEILQGINLGQTVVLTNGADIKEGGRVHLLR